MLLSQIVPADVAQRERFVTSLAALDAPLVIDGGWLLPQGQDSALAPLIKVFRRLPADRFETVKLAGKETPADGPRVFLVDLTQDTVTARPVKVDLPEAIPEITDPERKTWPAVLVKAVGELKKKSKEVEEFLGK